MIYKYEGSYGSRLHKVDKQLFIAYAQWTDKKSWELLGDKIPKTANEFQKQMRESCFEIKSEYEMTVVQDLLNDKRYIDNEK